MLYDMLQRQFRMFCCLVRVASCVTIIYFSMGRYESLIKNRNQRFLKLMHSFFCSWCSESCSKVNIDMASSLQRMYKQLVNTMNDCEINLKI